MNATRTQVAEIAARYSALLEVPFSDGQWEPGEATVVAGSHEEADADWIVSWEEGPYGWVDSEALNELAQDVLGGDWYAQPINHWCVAFYC